MGRRRTKDADLPERCYRHHGAIIYRPKEGSHIRLADEADVSGALREYGKLVGKGLLVVSASYQAPGKRRVGGLLDLYEREEMPKLAADTQHYYRMYLRHIRAVFADAMPSDIEPHHIYAFRSGVSSSDSSQTLCTRVFSAFFKFMIRQGDAITNPCRDVMCEPGSGRDTCPDAEDIDRFKETAGAWLSLYVDFKLTTGLRQRDLLLLPPIPLTAETFEVEIHKSMRFRKRTGARVGRTETYEVTPELREGLGAIYALPRPQSTRALFCNTRGKPYTPSGFADYWRRAMDRACAAHPTLERFHEHDLRATVATADPANAQRRLSHKNRTTTDNYLRQFKLDDIMRPLSLDKIRLVSGGKR